MELQQGAVVFNGHSLHVARSHLCKLQFYKGMGCNEKEVSENCEWADHVDDDIGHTSTAMVVVVPTNSAERRRSQFHMS
jgi:hypothetical protein